MPTKPTLTLCKNVHLPIIKYKHYFHNYHHFWAVPNAMHEVGRRGALQ